MVSLHDIAFLCHVSVGTVSKALNDRKDVSPETRKRIREAAKKLGYFNPKGENGAVRKGSGLIGVVSSGYAAFGAKDQSPRCIYESVFWGFCAAAEQEDMTVLLLSGKKEKRKELSYIAEARFRKLEALFILGDTGNRGVQDLLMQQGIPAVSVELKNGRIRITSNSGNNFSEKEASFPKETGKEAARILTERVKIRRYEAAE